MRKVLVHYHLFKNAGTSVDQCLNSSFGESWKAFDPPPNRGMYTSNEFEKIIKSNPDIVAFSSHCLVPPVRLNDIEVSPIIILREPISRIMSAFKFEWGVQNEAPKTDNDLVAYVEKKFSMRRRNAIENFQTMRLAVTDPSATYPCNQLCDDEIYDNACQFIDSLPAFGLVEKFPESIEWLQSTYVNDFPKLELQPVSTNVTRTADLSLSDIHQQIENTVGSKLYAEIVARNLLDIRLYAYASQRFSALRR